MKNLIAVGLSLCLFGCSSSASEIKPVAESKPEEQSAKEEPPVEAQPETEVAKVEAEPKSFNGCLVTPGFLFKSAKQVIQFQLANQSTRLGMIQRGGLTDLPTLVEGEQVTYYDDAELKETSAAHIVTQEGTSGYVPRHCLKILEPTN